MPKFRSLALAVAVLFLAACAAEPVKQSGPPAQESLPSVLRITGETGPALAVAVGLTERDIPHNMRKAERAAALDAFCSGAADGLALSVDLADAERMRCKQLGGDWSALSLDGTILYLDYRYADAFVEATSG